jgi:hypothetical protein
VREIVVAVTVPTQAVPLRLGVVFEGLAQKALLDQNIRASEVRGAPLAFKVDRFRKVAQSAPKVTIQGTAPATEIVGRLPRRVVCQCVLGVEPSECVKLLQRAFEILLVE